MGFELPAPAPARDRRVRRSRASLLQAAVTLVAERDTAAVPITDIAEAADVSRQVVYEQFGDHDTLLLEAALELARRELLPPLSATSPPLTGREKALVVARHFADHRAFYRAIFTGSCGFALDSALSGLLVPLNRQVIEQIYGTRLDPSATEDLARFLTGGVAALIHTWIVAGEGPLDPEECSTRLLRTMSVVTTA